MFNVNNSLYLFRSKPSFWVGKNSLKYWKYLVNENFAIKVISNGGDSPGHSHSGRPVSQRNGDQKPDSSDKSNVLSPFMEKSNAFLHCDNPSNGQLIGAGNLGLESSSSTKNIIGKKRVLDDETINDNNSTERTKRIRTVDSCRCTSTSNSVVNAISNNMDNIITNNFTKPLKQFDKSTCTVNNISELKCPTTPSQEMTECYVLIEKLESTMSLLKSKLYKIANQQQTQIPCDRKSEHKINAALQDVDLVYADTDNLENTGLKSEQILNDGIQFNTDDKLELHVDKPRKNTFSHVKINMELKTKDKIIDTMSKKKILLNEDLCDGDISLVSSPMRSYNNTKDRVLEQNKRGGVKSPDLRPCYTEEYQNSDNHTKLNPDEIKRELEITEFSYGDGDQRNNNDKQNQVDGEKKKKIPKDPGYNEGEEDEANSDENTQKEFNEDIMCPHGK